MNNRKTYYIVSVLLAAALLFLDQYTKLLAVRRLKGRESFVVIDRILEFSYLENTGAAFSSFSGRQVFLIMLTSLVILFIIWKYCRLPLGKRFFWMKGCLLLIISGALGNLIDRVRYRYVVDFIYFVPIDFPKFNVADMYITVGVAALALLMFFFYQEEELEALL
ncbi:MAG: signal peptidase II [Clostridiales bacterium]|nr:signal peptidase II [Clostridiales bacterium]